MKKILLFLAFTLLFSCKKKDTPPECYACRTQSVSTIGTTVIRSSDDITHPCNLSADDVLKYIEERTFVRRTQEPNPPYGTEEVTTTSVCNCVKE